MQILYYLDCVSLINSGVQRKEQSLSLKQLGKTFKHLFLLLKNFIPTVCGITIQASSDSVDFIVLKL